MKTVIVLILLYLFAKVVVTYAMLVNPNLFLLHFYNDYLQSS